MKYRVKLPIVEAHRWYQNGDHPDDGAPPMDQRPQPWSKEGKVVRYFRNSDVGAGTLCFNCSERMHDHGWIDTREDGYVVCRGDWIITGLTGEYYPCKSDIFERIYEPHIEGLGSIAIDLGSAAS